MNVNPIQAAGRAHLEAQATAFAAYIAAEISARIRGSKDAAEVFEARWPRSLHTADIRAEVAKAAISVGSTTGWGAPISAASPLASAFLAYVRPKTILGRMSGMKPVPLNTRFSRQTAAAAVGWVAEGGPKLVSALAFDGMVMLPAKCGAICVVSKELALSSDPSAVELLKSDLAASIVHFCDVSFIDPSIAAVPGVSPASITNGATEIPSTGNFPADFRALVAAANGAGLVSPYLISTAEVAVGLCGLDNDLTRDSGAVGGSIGKIPLLCSASAPPNSLTLVDASQVLLGEGELEVDTSGQSSLQMASAPDVPPSSATILRSLWQENLIAVLLMRYLNWLPARPNCVAYISGLTFAAERADAAHRR